MYIYIYIYIYINIYIYTYKIIVNFFSIKVNFNMLTIRLCVDRRRKVKFFE